jgi:HD superfamily phosphohydrolase
MSNKRKIINDPVHGFIAIPSGLHYDIIQHPFFQRLSRIRQLGLIYMVYPGAVHTRFQHSLGAMHLMNEAIDQLRLKGHEITGEEAEAVLAAILLHDTGHAPFSHALENTITEGISHEEISLLMMQIINREMNGKLDMALEIFQNKYPKHFLHQLVSSQLDVDRLDYLIRDSFFTGVVEGAVGTARIIKMLNVHDDQLVVEAKGIYSIEKFLIARRIMFWQVYSHKACVAAEQMLVNALRRAKELAMAGEELFASPSLRYFLYNEVDKKRFISDEKAFQHYALFDDSDILSAVKVWASHPDTILSMLSKSLVDRKLFKTEILEDPVEDHIYQNRIKESCKIFGISEHEASYLLSQNSISVNTYTPKDDNINILYNDGTVRDIAEASDILDISMLSKQVKKYYLCCIKDKN